MTNSSALKRLYSIVRDRNSRRIAGAANQSARKAQFTGLIYHNRLYRKTDKSFQFFFGAPKNDLSVLSTLSIRPSNSHGKSLKPQSLFSISTFLSKTTNWQPVSTTNPQIRTVTYCTRLPTHLTSKTQFRTPNFSDSVGSAAKIQTLTPNATKCPISFPNVAILTASCLKHSIVSKTSIENPF